MSKKQIRSEKHKLKATSENVANCQRMVDQYRKLVSALISLVFVYLPDINKLKHDKLRLTFVENLFHKTKENPNPKYIVLDKLFAKFPSYLRRVAINAAIGAANSFNSNYSRWQRGQRTKATSKPPQLGKFYEINPALYGGQCLKFSLDFKSVQIKGLTADGKWCWSEPMQMHGKLKRLSLKQHLAPMLLINGTKMYLSCPVQVSSIKLSSKYFAGLDMGINNDAAVSIVDSTGTVITRRLFNCGKHNDQIDKLMQQIRNKAKSTKTLQKGFCQQLYRRINHLNRDKAILLSKQIFEFLQKHHVSVLALEHLQGWRPKSPKKSMRHRFHRFLHRNLVKHLEYVTKENGVKMKFVNPRGTSAWAFDGSGKVTRSKNSLCAFKSGKQYHADLNASLNIVARYLATLLGLTVQRELSSPEGGAVDASKSSRTALRMPVVLSDIWAHSAQLSAKTKLPDDVLCPVSEARLQCKALSRGSIHLEHLLRNIPL